MEITQTYAIPSSAQARGDGLGFSLSTETARPGVHLEALVRHSRAYGRVMLALHRVVAGDARFGEKDHGAYQEWVRGQYLLELGREQQVLQQKMPALHSELETLLGQLGPLDARAGELDARLRRLGNIGAKSYNDALKRYWNYLYKADRDMWYVLDPVVSVHPDATLFEVFSLDESIYGCVRVPAENLDVVGETSYGTTNVDYGRKLADEMARVRDYRGAFLSVGSGGVSVQTSAGARVEKKIDLPPSWVRGFLQVQSASALASVSLSLSATTVGEILRLLNARREDVGPRSLKFELTPGQRPTIEIEPWGTLVRESKLVYGGRDAQTVRIWGRRRLAVLSELLPHARAVEVRLLGDGLPSFWALELEGHRFELGMSGWTTNDWSAAARFDALASSGKVSDADLETAARELEKRLLLSGAQLGETTDLSRVAATGALQKLCAQGRAMFDPVAGAYRWRQLLPFAAPESPADAKAKAAARWVEKGLVEVETVPDIQVQNDEFLKRYDAPEITFWRAVVKSEGGNFNPLWASDADGRVRFWQCTCGEFRRDKGRGGPCAHLLAGLGETERERAATSGASGATGVNG